MPLIVVDPSSRFTGDIDVPRQGLTSSVDILPLLVSLGHGGRRDWLVGDLGRIYRERHDLLPMLRSSQAPGRQYVLLASDEGVQGYLNFNSSPTHLFGVRPPELKFGLYANWKNGTAEIADDGTLETELYDLKYDLRIPALKQALLTNLIPNVLRAPLPGALGVAQDASKYAYLIYDALLQNVRPPGSSGGVNLQAQLPFGQDF